MRLAETITSKGTRLGISRKKFVGSDFLPREAVGSDHGGAPRDFSRGRKKGAAREGECGRRASTVTSLLFNHKAEPALSPKVTHHSPRELWLWWSNLPI